MNRSADPRVVVALLAIPVSAALGLMAMVIPALFMDREPHGVVAFFPLAAVAVEGFGVPAAIGLFCAGLITGLTLRAPFWVIGPSSMAAFPSMAIVEMLVEPRSHTMFPFEFFFYGQHHSRRSLVRCWLRGYSRWSEH
jgi:hypothetical protein